MIVMMRIAVLAVLTAGPAGAVPLTMMFERDADGGPGEEVAFRTYASVDDLLDDDVSAPDVFSPINISANFSTTGLTFDGLRYIMMFERDADAGPGAEVAFRTYASFDDLLDDDVSAPDVFSPINISANFSTTGVTFDGLRYILMFERDADAGAGAEVAFRTYASFEDLLDDDVSAPDVFSPINISANFSTTGLTWDGSQYVMMFERDADAGPGAEVAFRTYASFDDLLNDDVSAPDVFSPINISANFSTTGLMAQVDFDGGGEPPAPVPLPPALALMLAGLAGLAGVDRLGTRRRARRDSALGRRGD
jgi:hypothetical protein